MSIPVCGLQAMPKAGHDSFKREADSCLSVPCPPAAPSSRRHAEKMGNQNSRSTSGGSSSNPQSPTSNVTTSHAHHHERGLHPPHSQYHSARRRESIQALSAAKAPAAPSVSLENAQSHPTSSRPISRGRAQTLGTSDKESSLASQLRAAQDHYRPAATTTTPIHDIMGNEQSSQKAAKDKGRHHHHMSPASTTTTPTVSPPQPQATTTLPAPVPVQQQQPLRAPSPTLPVDVPALPREDVQDGGASSIDPADASQDYLIPSSQFSRPPRLPLPIEEEVHTPGSPIISPEEIWSPVHETDAEGMLPRRSSTLSTTTADDEDLGDEFKAPSTGRPTVPTLIEWEGPGERVYVTGTFAGWNRKYKLHRK